MRVVTTALGTTLLALSVASAAQAGPARPCVDESERLVGQRAAILGKDFRAPRKMRDVAIALPPRDGDVAASPWVGEALVDQAGAVKQVWTVRAPKFDPPWPEFETAVTAAIRQWTYEPSVVEGRPSPVCVTVVVTPH
jgi:hypothetical protein